MSLAGKIGLTAGALTLLVGAAASLLSGGGGSSSEDLLHEVGYRVAGQIAAIDSSSFVSVAPKATSRDPVKAIRKHFEKLFGEENIDRWDNIYEQITDTSQWDQMDADEKIDAQRKLNNLREYEKKLRTGGDDTGEKVDGSGILSRAIKMTRADPNAAGGATPSGVQVLAAWVRERHRGDAKGEGAVVASAGGYKLSQLQFDPGALSRNSLAHVPATLTDAAGTTYDVNLYVAVSPTRPHFSAYVAAMPNGDAGGGSKSPVMGLLASLVGAAVVGLLASSIAGKHTQGVRNLAREIDRLGTSGDPDRGLRAQGPEASALARSVERMVGNIEFRSKHDGADLDEVVGKEQQVATEIHGALMSKNPPRLQGYEVETLFKPGFEIGGDHFEYFKIDDTHLGVVLLDTNVRGIAAALVISQAKAYVRAAAPGTLSPAAVLRSVNKNLAGELPAGRHVTALYAVIDTAAGKAMLASAGHLPLIVYRHGSGKVFKVNPEGIALGLDKGRVFDDSLEEGDVPIGVGDRIVLYTDGALMVANEEGEEFGEQRFYGAVSREAPKNSQAFVNFVGSAIDQFHLPAPQNDDITISTVKRLR